MVLKNLSWIVRRDGTRGREDYGWRVNRYSISVGALGKHCEWNARLPWCSATCSLYHRRRACLPLLSRPQRNTQLFPESPVRSEKPQTHRHRRNPQSLGNFLGRVLEDVAQQARLAEIRSQLGDRGGHNLRISRRAKRSSGSSWHA